MFRIVQRMTDKCIARLPEPLQLWGPVLRYGLATWAFPFFLMYPWLKQADSPLPVLACKGHPLYRERIAALTLAFGAAMLERAVVTVGGGGGRGLGCGLAFLAVCGAMDCLIPLVRARARAPGARRVARAARPGGSPRVAVRPLLRRPLRPPLRAARPVLLTAARRVFEHGCVDARRARASRRSRAAQFRHVGDACAPGLHAARRDRLLRRPPAHRGGRDRGGGGARAAAAAASGRGRKLGDGKGGGAGSKGRQKQGAVDRNARGTGRWRPGSCWRRSVLDCFQSCHR